MSERDKLQKTSEPEIIEEIEEQPEDPKVRRLKLLGVGATLVVIAMLASESGSVVIYVPIIAAVAIFLVIFPTLEKLRAKKEQKKAGKAAAKAKAMAEDSSKVEAGK